MDNFWLKQAFDRLGTPRVQSLSAHVTADVTIVGGGYLGLWTAIRIKERSPSLKVAVVERDLCGSGASGRNGGFVTSFWAKYLSLHKLCGTAEATRIAKSSAEAVLEIGAFCRDNGVNADFRADGWLWTATSPPQIGCWNVLIDELGKHNVRPFEVVDNADVARLSGTSRNLAGVFEPDAATVQPAILAFGLRRHAQKLGVTIYEHSPMVRLERTKTPKVITHQGSIASKKVILAMNAWGAKFSYLRRKVAIVSSDMIATTANPGKLREIGFENGMAICDSRMFLNYYRNTPDGRIVFGKSLGHFAFAGQVANYYEGPSHRAGEVEESFRKLYPMLDDMDIESSWTGPIDRSVDGLPFFGRLDNHPDILFGIGFSGQGVGPTVLGGKILASLALDQNDHWSNCGLVRERVDNFPIEPFRYVGSVLVREALRRKEGLEDHSRRPDPLTLAISNLAPVGYVPSKRD
ncbi:MULTISPECIES: FAD-dependent oxidoreductase [unclassified Bradyrhizobium]|uniref:FAD-dependent oxidoreductase n=1 Tax=unclassified Bradyrhizobium TaxID=2631580 RepID=UPI00024D1D26|nr:MULTISPECIES: FAD-dependent oxidoreductase [Bradyrhizobium]EHR01016.1 glycine/D-amino acid oxidase, deaminating [Bradyrhizobium sp. WSM471]UFW43074.1 FAD-binding oxidoreductase [Bradyrhizobium canariense]